MASSCSSRITRDLKVLLFNANGLLRQKDEFSIFLNSHDIDVALISEVKLSEDIDFTINNYTIYRKQTGKYGGVAILIKSRLPHSYKEIFNFKFIEIITIELYINNEAVVIGSVYHPPSQGTDIKEYEELFNTDGSYIYAGDFNARHKSWNCSKTSVRGEILKQAVDEFDAVVLAPDEPTFLHYNGTGSDVLDILIHSNKVYPRGIQVIHELDSNHLPVIVAIDFNTNFQQYSKSI